MSAGEKADLTSMRDCPPTIEAAARLLVGELPEDQRAELRAYPRERLYELHFPFGHYIRKRLGLWEPGNALVSSLEWPDREPDRISSKIIEAMWQALQAEGEP